MSPARLIARNTSFVAAGDVASKLASLAFYIVMARALGKHGLGDFTFALAVVLFIELSEFGTSVVLTREVARGRERLAGLYWSALAAKLAVGAAGAAAGLGVALVGGYPPYVVETVGLLAVAKLVELGSTNAHAVLRGIEDMAPIPISLVVQRFATAAVGIAAMVAGGGVLAVAVVYLGGAVLGLLYLLWALDRRRLRPRLELSRSSVVGLLRVSWPYGLSAVAMTLFGRIDAMILSLMKGNTAVGEYGAAYRLFDGTLFLSWAFGLAMLPSLSRLGRSTSPSIGAALEGASKVIAIVAFPIGVGIALFAEPIITTAYGTDFAASVAPARILGGAIALYGLFFVASNVLLAHDRQREVVAMSAVTAVANIALNLALIPSLSARGAAIAMTASQVILTGLALLLALRVTGRISLRRIALGPAAGASVMVVAAVLFGTGARGLAIALVAYPLTVAAVEARFFPADLRFLRAALTRRPAADHARAAAASTGRRSASESIVR